MEGRLIDYDYSFELHPSGNWRILSEATRRALSADSIATLIGVEERYEGTSLSVLVESLGDDLSLEDFAELTSEPEFSETGDLEPLASEPMDFHGQKAIRVIHRGKLGGAWLRYDYVLFIRGGLAFQFMTFGPLDDHAAERADRLLACVRLRPEAPVGRMTVEPTPDQRGVDWCIQGGVFVHVALGVAAQAPDGWRLMVRRELADIDEDAALGFYHMDSGSVALLQLDRVPPAGHRSYGDGWRESCWAGWDVREPWSPDPDARPPGRTVQVGWVEELGMSFALESWSIGPACLTAMGAVLGLDSAKASVVYPAFDAIRPATPAELAEAQATLDREPQTPDEAFDRSCFGPSISYRGGRLRLFDLGLVLDVPIAGRWKVKAGFGVEWTDLWDDSVGCKAAELESKLLGVDISLSATEPVADQDADRLDVKGQHGMEVASAMEAGEGEEEEEQETAEVQVGGVKGLVTSLTEQISGGERKVMVWTFPILGGRSYATVTASGYTQDLDAALPSIDGVVGSIRVKPKPMRVSMEAGGVYINHLYGFSINSRLDESGKAGAAQVSEFKDVTPKELAGSRLMLSIREIGSRFRLWVIPTGRPDGPTTLGAEEFLMAELDHARRSSHVLKWDRTNPGPTDFTFGGYPATRKRFGNRLNGADSFVVRRGRLVFGAIIEGDETERDTYAGWLSIF